MNETTGISIAEKEKTRRTFVWAGVIIIVAIVLSWGVHGAIQARYGYESRRELYTSIGLFTGAVVKFTEAVGDLRDMTAGMEIESVAQDGHGINIYNKESTQTVGGDITNGTKDNNDPLCSQKTCQIGKKKQSESK